MPGKRISSETHAQIKILSTGRPKITNKRMDDSIILAAKKSPRKSSRAIQAGLPK